ncbi:MAG: hypothetical protein KBE27_03675, partial [Syntrophorhabdaceae bacterium]|nr:hypothetical protein [Syntrophorhabdaceae bacterium]
MAFSIPKIKYTGRINEVTIGTGEKAVRIGGEGCYPFYTFEGEMPNPPRIAYEVWDMEPDDWQDWALEPFRDVIHDPVMWARKCIDIYDAEIIALQLRSADPNGADRDVEDVITVVEKVEDSIDCPLIVWGTSNDD